MTLILEIEYLSGVSFAAVSQDRQEPDWPPQPDRVFSALVAAWAVSGQGAAERKALEWLEALPAPVLVGSGHSVRTSAIAYVPPNDSRSDRAKHAREVLPALRSRQPRRFPAARPHEPVVRMLWPGAEPDEATVAALQRLARNTAYVGHSASMTRCRFSAGILAVDPDQAKPVSRTIYPGRFAELRRAYDAGRRPLPGARVRRGSEPTRPRRSVFADRWLVFEHVDGAMPDIRASTIVAKGIRDTLLSGYSRIGLGDQIPETLSGHTPDGYPTRQPHVAIVPMAFVGYPHADGHVMGFALVPPHNDGLLDDPDFRRAVANLAPMDERRGRRICTITTTQGTAAGEAFRISLAPTFEAARRSLDPRKYVVPARIFATITPIVLDHHLKKKGYARLDEIEGQIATACSNVGLPRPELIVADKHSAIEGTPSAYTSGGSPAWMRWRLAKSLASRQLTHATLQFPELVDGPIILGAGRFLGLGLCQPLGGGSGL